MDKLEQIDEQIALCLTGEADKTTLYELESWCGESDEHRAYLAEQCEIWFSACDGECLRRYDAERAYEQFRERVGNYGDDRMASR